MNQFAYAVLLSRERPVCFVQLGGVGPTWRGKACPPESSRRYGHVWMACLAAVFVALGLSATKWADSFRRRFRWGNSAFLRRFWRCFGHHAVFPRSFPLECISLLWTLLSTGSLQEYPRQTGNLLHRPQRLPLSCGAALPVFCFLGNTLRNPSQTQFPRLPDGIRTAQVWMNRKPQYIGVEVWLLHVYLTYFSEIQQSILLFSLNEFNNGAIVCMTAWMIVMCAKMVVQGCFVHASSCLKC